MADRASVHITIGGMLPRKHVASLTAHAEDYDLRTGWDSEPFNPADLIPGKPLELYGTDLNDGQIPELDTFCCEHGLPFRRWSGGCFGAFLPEIVLFDGTGDVREYMASEDEQVLFPPAWIKGFTRLRDLELELAKAEVKIPPFVIL